MSSGRGTLLLIGATGNGKSEFANGYLQRSAFRASPGPESVTLITSAAETTIDGWCRCVIDTPGLDDHRGVGPEHDEQMVKFLSHYQHGVNAVALVINGQCPRISTETEKMIRLLEIFFGDGAFWHHLCIVFTKCFEGVEAHQDDKRTTYRDLILQVAVNCAGESVRDIPLPVFCVDSPTWRSSSETAQELAALHAFVVTLNPLPTESLVAPNPKWYKIEIETEANVLVSAREELLPNGMVQIVRLQDRERQRLTDYDGTTITFSEWREIRAWEETRTFTVAVETVTELIPPEGSGVSTDGCARYRTKQRANTTRFDGSVLYGEWTTIHEWEEAEEVPGEQRARARHTSSAGPVTPDDIELRHT